MTTVLETAMFISIWTDFYAKFKMLAFAFTITKSFVFLGILKNIDKFFFTMLSCSKLLQLNYLSPTHMVYALWPRCRLLWKWKNCNNKTCCSHMQYLVLKWDHLALPLIHGTRNLTCCIIKYSEQFCVTRSNHNRSTLLHWSVL